MLAQDVADARAVPGPERTERRRRDAFVRMRYDERGVVLDSRTGAQRANEVVDLLA